MKPHKCDQKESNEKDDDDSDDDDSDDDVSDDDDSDDDDDLVEVLPIASPKPTAPQNPTPHPIRTEREMMNFIVQEYLLNHGYNLAAASFTIDANQV